MKIIGRILTIGLIPFAMGHDVCRAATLSTSFVNVIVQDVPLGVPYLLQDARGRGIIIRNSGESALSVNLEISIPNPEELNRDAMPIPDPSWIRILPSARLIPAKKEVECSISIDIPNERKYSNQFYQATLWIRSGTVGENGVQVRAGLKSRIQFMTQKL